MIRTTTAIALGCCLMLAACASDEREWMKLNEKYTTADFHRDLAQCRKGGKLDEACMRERGWVAVTPSQAKEKRDDPLARDIGAPGSRR